MSPHFGLKWCHKLEILFDGAFDGRVGKTIAEISATQRQETETILQAL